MTNSVYVKRSAVLATRFGHDAQAGAETNRYHMSLYLHTQKDKFGMHDYQVKHLGTGHANAL